MVVCIGSTGTWVRGFLSPTSTTIVRAVPGWPTLVYYIDDPKLCMFHSQTMNHNFHVHVNRVPPYPSSKNPCAAQYSSVHYNPFNVNSTAEAGYSAACNAHGQMRCELGDLSGKTGQLNIDGSNQLRTVHMLPLEGRQSSKFSISACSICLVPGVHNATPLSAHGTIGSVVSR